LDQYSQTANGNLRGICIVCETDQKLRKRENRLNLKYRITPEEYNAYLENQYGRCAICAKFSERTLHMDHDHETQQLRGLLCSNCNVGLGMFQDDPVLLRRALEYIVKHRNIHRRRDEQERRERRRTLVVDRGTRA
jgi:hypothetical protein